MEHEPDVVPTRLDLTRPNSARIYDYLLGGSHNFAIDRAAGEELLADHPQMRSLARANRGFLRHAVEMCLSAGIRQFLDLGSGILTAGSVHEIIDAQASPARVAYVDAEPVAVTANRRILGKRQSSTMVDADLRLPNQVLTNPGVVDLLDFDRPLAVLALGILHFLPDTGAAPGALGILDVLRGYRAALAPGSVLAVSHSSTDYPDHPDLAVRMAAASRRYRNTPTPNFPRTRAELTRLLTQAGFTVPDEEWTELCAWGPGAYLPGGGQPPLGGYATIATV